MASGIGHSEKSLNNCVPEGKKLHCSGAYKHVIVAKCQSDVWVHLKDNSAMWKIHLPIMYEYVTTFVVFFLLPSELITL